MSEPTDRLNHADRREIVLHEILGAEVQYVQTADRVQLLLRRMQPSNWPGASWDMRPVAAQVHRIGQSRLLHRFRDRIALALLVFPGGNRRQQQVGRERSAEGF